MDTRLAQVLQAKAARTPRGGHRTRAQFRAIAAAAKGRAPTTAGKPTSLHQVVAHVQTLRRAMEADRSR